MSHPPIPGRRLASLLSLMLMFAAGVGGAWAWFHVGTRERRTNWELVPRSAVTGYTFQPAPVSAKESEILASTNLLSGNFTNVSGRRFTVFFGDWRAKSAREMNVVQHTPDICWVGAGWTPAALDLPATLVLDFGGQKLPFECRAFHPPHSPQVELAAWCTLVSGQVFEEGDRFSKESDVTLDRRQRFSAAGRRVARDQFLHVLQQRIPGDGTKQFVRYSMALLGPPERALEELKQFGQAWLELHASVATEN